MNYRNLYNEPIDVIAYSGRKGDERPEAFILRGLRIDVVQIPERWIEEGLKDRVRKIFFRIKGSDGAYHKLYFNEDKKAWFYQSWSK